MRKCATAGLVGLAALLGQALTAQALINPNFTPVHLVRQSDVILLIKFGKPDEKGKVTVTVDKVLKDAKGTFALKALTVDLAGTGQPEITKHVMKMVADQGAEPALFFYGAFVEDNANVEPEFAGFIHLTAKWLRMERLKEDAWDVVALDKGFNMGMQATWAGGTDMLIREVNYVLTDPQPECPPGAGVSFGEKVKIGTVPGTIARLMTVDLADNGVMSLFVASDSGDRLIAYQPKAPQFKDVTAERALTSKSKVVAWGDFDGNKRLDLASWDGQTLTLFLQGADGKFTQQPVKAGDAFKAGVAGLAVLDVGVPGKAGLLVSTPAAPLLLVPGADGALAVKALSEKPLPLKDLGQVGPALVADLDGDAVGDVLQLYANGAMFYRGNGAGAFADPVRRNVALGKPPWDASLGDFDQDGLFDVFVAAEDGCKLYHNRDNGRFEESISISGEIEYISQANAIVGQTCDVNNDGRQDIFIAYSNREPQVFFNRGFRSTGHSHELAIEEGKGDLEEALKGQQAGLFADMNGDGAQDMIVAVPDGNIYMVYRNVDLDAALVARAVLPLGGTYAGPVTVLAYAEKRCLGVWSVVAGSSEAFVGRSEPGPLELRWQFPGGKPQKTNGLTLEEGPKRLVLEPGK